MNGTRRSEIAPTFDELDDRHGLAILDQVESVRFELWTPERVTATSTSTAQFPYPMDSAVRIRTGSIEIPKLADVIVRDEDGVFVTNYSTADERLTVPAGTYNLDLTTAPLKLHLLVKSDIEIRRTDRTTVIVDFGSKVEITVAARSFHDLPAGTITVPDDPEAMMDAVSLFGTALKTTSPERSFPSLRGHPPRVKLGNERRISEGIDAPATDVTLVIPPKRRLIYQTAPLAYYLGAEVVPGTWPRLIAGDYEHVFPRPSREIGWNRKPDDFERAVHRTFKQAFVMDCIVRTEGIYPVDLYEREQFEKRALESYDLAQLYEMPLAERLANYLDISYKTVEPLIPDWGLLVEVVPTAENVELLPYLAADLALVRTTPPPEHRELRPNDPISIQMHGVQEPQEPPNPDNPEVHDMSYAGKTFDSPPANTIEHAFLGDGFPDGSNKLYKKAFDNQIGGHPADGTPVTVHVVCNDKDIEDIDLVASVYGDRNILDIDVSYDYLVTTDELEEIVHSPINLLHFIGEVNEEGFVCTDGILDRLRVYQHGVQSFFVQHCGDYGDLEWLIRRGAYAGVVTTTSIQDKDDSLMMGRWMGRLLNQGFTLRSTANIVDQVYPDLTDYVVLGDGGFSISQAKGFRPIFEEIKALDGDSFELSSWQYPNKMNRFGEVQWRNIDSKKLNSLAPGRMPPVELSRNELTEYLDLGIGPISIDGEYLWSDDPFLEQKL